MSATRVVGFVCGTCLEVQRADAQPDACFVCGARFGGASPGPLAVARVEVATSGRAKLRVRTRVDFTGRWSAGERAFAVRQFAPALAPGDERKTQDRSTRTVDGG